MMMMMMMKQKEGSNEPEDTQGDTKDSSAYGTDNKDNNFVGFLFLSAWRHMLYSRQGGDTHELILLYCQSIMDVWIKPNALLKSTLMLSSHNLYKILEVNLVLRIISSN